MKCITVITVFLAFVFSYTLNAQTIKGVVYDAKTKEAIPGVVVYFDGTSIHTTTDKDGKFILFVNQKLNTTLVFKHLSYESLIIKNPFEYPETSFFLKEKMNILSEAVVVASSFSGRPRAEKMELFKKVFLGESVAGSSCVILNEDDIVLHYDETTEVLEGYSLVPIIIENRRLAYRITYDLRSFSARFTNTMSLPNVKTNIITTTVPGMTFSYHGNSFFEDLSNYNVSITNRRNDIYLSSRDFFWKNFVMGTLHETKFKIYNRSRQIRIEEYFTIIDLPHQKTVLINPGTNLNRRHADVHEGTIYGVLRISYDNVSHSEIVFRTNRFSVDDKGNPNPLADIVYFGDMSNQRVGDMLPLDFVYSPTQISKRR